MCVEWDLLYFRCLFFRKFQTRILQSINTIITMQLTRDDFLAKKSVTYRRSEVINIIYFYPRKNTYQVSNINIMDTWKQGTNGHEHWFARAVKDIIMGLPNPKVEGFASPNLKGMDIVSSEPMGRPTLRVWVLGILNANRKIRKRTDTDVAFTREYSRVSIFHRERECTN